INCQYQQMQSASDQAMQSGRQLVDSPPVPLTRLVRMVARAFYTGEQAVIVDYLCKRTIVKEEDMAQLFRLDMKQLRQLLVALKQDQLIRSKKRMETSADGRVSKYDYFYINYEVFVNVVKYKLDTMQHRLEREQREFTARAAFHCTACAKTFTDLEVNELMDFSTGELKCSFCNAEVVEEENMATRQDLRLNMARFHEQVRDPLDALLKEIERFRFGPSLLEPPLTELASGGGPPGAAGDRPDLAGSSSSASLLGGGGGSSATITVDMSTGGDESAGKTGVKEVPQWMLGSTIALDEDSNSRFSLDGGGGGGGTASAGGSGLDSARKVEIQDLLIQNEVRQKKLQEQQQKQQQQQQQAAASAKSKKKKKPAKSSDDEDDEDDDDNRANSSTSPSTSDSDVAIVDAGAAASAGPSAAKRFRADVSDDSEDDDEDDDDDSDDDDLSVTFQGKRIPYDEVTEQMVQQMNPEEKANYAAVGQKYYSMFDD
ncbi:hypothetical protein BOX15_Mlig031866g1, partial [Macrostomum lignano]